MSTSRSILATMIAGGACGTVLGGAVSAALGAANGAIGAAILNASGHEGHDVLQATQISAAGNALWGGAVGCVSGAFSLFSNNSERRHSQSFMVAAMTYVGSQVVGGMIGYGLFLAAAASEVPFGALVADVAVGGAITLGGLTCLGVTLACCGLACGAVEPPKLSANFV